MGNLSWLWVFLGGGMGSVARYTLSSLNATNSEYPWGTYISNMLACLVLGVLSGIISKSEVNQTLVLLFSVGFCGGFSTFSSFTKEKIELLQQGAYITVGIYFVLSIIIGMFCFCLGYYCIDKTNI